MKLVRFNIFRKAAFVGALLPYNIYINGKFVGTIKNGKTLNVEIPEADVYYLEDNNSFETAIVILASIMLATMVLTNAPYFRMNQAKAS